jgi:hypothetical protein
MRCRPSRFGTRSLRISAGFGIGGEKRRGLHPKPVRNLGEGAARRGHDLLEKEDQKA